MSFIIVFLLCWSSVVYGGLIMSRQLLTCPIPPCAYPFCDNPVIQYFTYEGMICPGCPVCPVPQPAKRLLTIRPFICPVVDCAYPMDCAVAWEPGTIIINGYECPGCPTCPVLGTGLPTE